MANNRIEMVNVKHILRLKIQGTSNRGIAKVLSVSRQTVNDYVRFFKSTGHSFQKLYEMRDEELVALFPLSSNKQIAKYELLAAQFSYYEKELKKTGGTYQNLWEEYRLAQPDGYSYSQFRNHIQSWLAAKAVRMRVEHKYGDKLFVDYAGKKLYITDRATGEKTAVEVFVAILGGSQLSYAEASASQKLDDFLASMSNALSYIGGVPKAIVPDNLKSAVTRSNPYEPEVNRNFKEFGLHYNTSILPTRAYKARDKALVEGMVKIVYQQIYFPLRNQVFFSLEDLNEAIRKALEKLNTKPFSGRDYSRKALFESEEQHLLGPLPKGRFERKLYRRYKVNKDTHVWFKEDKHYYSVPYKYVGKHIRVQATARVLEIYFNYERIALHQRSSKVGGFTTNKAHLPANIRFVKDWSMEGFTSKAQAIGAPVYEYFCQIFERRKHPEQAYKSCMGLLSLAKKYPAERFIRACKRATYFNNYSYKAIKNILEKSMDELELEQAPSPQLQDSIINESEPNIRGAVYYQ